MQEVREVAANIHFQRWWIRSGQVLEKYDVIPAVPRRREKKGSKPLPVIAPEEYYRSMANQYIDEVLKNLRDQFKSKSIVPPLLIRLMPKYVAVSTSMPDYQPVLQLYEGDLPPGINDFKAEYQDWKAYVLEEKWASRSLTEVIQAIPSDRFPRIFVLLQILAVILVTTATGRTSLLIH